MYPPLFDYDVSMDEVVELVGVILTSPRSSKNGVRMKKLSPFLYCNFFKLEFLLRTFVPVNQMGGRIFWPDLAG
jgi:hypothetical protein